VVGAQSAPTAAMDEGANTNRTRVHQRLVFDPRPSRQTAFGGQSNGRSLRASVPPC